jgi:hypothetical protein
MADPIVQLNRALFWVVHVPVNAYGKPSTRPWQIRRRWMDKADGQFCSAFESEKAAREACAKSSRDFRAYPVPFEVQALRSWQYLLSQWKVTQHKPPDAGQGRIVCKATGMVCDCGALDADDCDRPSTCRMWRDFSIAPYGTVEGDGEVPFDPGSGYSQRAQRELAELLEYVRASEDLNSS